VSHGWASVRPSSTLGRYSSAIRAACANERSCGSARGAISDGRPYRDRQLAPVQGLTALRKDTSPDSSTPKVLYRLGSTMALSQRHNSAGGPQILDQMKIRCGRHQIVEGNVVTV